MSHLDVWLLADAAVPIDVDRNRSKCALDFVGPGGWEGLIGPGRPVSNGSFRLLKGGRKGIRKVLADVLALVGGIPLVRCFAGIDEGLINAGDVLSR